MLGDDAIAAQGDGRLAQSGQMPAGILGCRIGVLFNERSRFVIVGADEDLLKLSARHLDLVIPIGATLDELLRESSGNIRDGSSQVVLACGLGQASERGLGCGRLIDEQRHRYTTFSELVV